MPSKPLRAVSAPDDAPPAHLSGGSKGLWKAVLRDYDLEAHERTLLRLALEALDRADEARARVTAEGMTTETKAGRSMPHPCVAIERDNRVLVARLLRELALDALPAPDPRVPRRYR